MKTQMSLLFFLTLNISLHAQTNYAWAHSMGGMDNDDGAIIEVSSTGDVYTTGSFVGTVDFDPGPGIFDLSPVSSSIFLQKLDSAGNFLWAIEVPWNTDIKVDKKGNVFITGGFSGPFDFDPGPGTFPMTVLGSSDAYILKLDSNGDFLWAIQLGGSSPSVGYDYIGQDLAVDNSGNVYLLGAFEGAGDFDPGPGTFMLDAVWGVGTFVLKLDSLGVFQWAAGFGSSGNPGGGGLKKPEAIEVLPTGGVVFSGIFDGAMDADPGPGVANLVFSGPDFFEGFIVKLDAFGNYGWSTLARGYPPLSNFSQASLDIDSLGNIYTTGHFAGTIDFDPGPDTFLLSGAPFGHAFIQKNDSFGNFTWAKSLPVPSLRADVSPLNEVLLTGLFYNTLDADPGPGVDIISAQAYSDIFIEKLDTAGNYLWVETFSGPNYSQVFSIAVDPWGNILTTGRFDDTLDIDPDTGVVNLISLGGTDIFISKLSPDPCFNYGVMFDSIVDVSCTNQGYLSAKPLGGIPPYTYQWTPQPAVIDSFIYLDTMGIYSIAITDSLGCQQSKSIWMSSPSSNTGFDLQAHLVTDIFQPGFSSNVWIDAFNNGCAPVTGQLSLVLPSQVSYDSTTHAPDFINGDTLFWDFTNWTDDSSHFQPQIFVTTSTSTNIGDQLCFDLTITPIIGDNDSSNNSVTICNTVLGSYDPNDKRVHPEGSCDPAYVLKDQTLTYTIRFQNTGTADAVNIFIIDSLDTELDLNTFSVLGQSHDPMITEILPGNVIKFRFDNIYLPDSNNNEPESHGFVIFEIDPLPGLADGSQIENFADIYFDFNDPITTNTVLNTLVDSVSLNQVNLKDSTCGFYTWNGKHYFTSGTYVQVFSASDGCDSTVTLNLKILPSYNFYFPDSACNSYTWNDQTYDSSGVYIQLLSSSDGCDSTVAIELTIDSLDTSVLLENDTLFANQQEGVYQWINCDLGGVLINGETGQKFIPESTGNYAVIVSNGICTETSDCLEVMISSTGIDSESLVGGLKYYPNPTDGMLHLTWEKSYKNISVKVNNLIGQTISHFEASNTDRMEFELLEKRGMYLIDIVADSEHTVLKVVKE